MVSVSVSGKPNRECCVGVCSRGIEAYVQELPPAALCNNAKLCFTPNINDVAPQYLIHLESSVARRQYVRYLGWGCPNDLPSSQAAVLIDSMQAAAGNGTL